MKIKDDVKKDTYINVVKRQQKEMIEKYNAPI
jgi:hypothetical protein